MDIFVLFGYQQFKDKSAELSNFLAPALKKAFPQLKLKRLHGSRDYFQVPFQKTVFEVVPILKINKAEEAVNITDISPLHAVWVNKNVKAKDEVLLAKQFFKANKLYGAESYITGFSGYVLEILTAYYGSFEKLLQAAVRWELKEVIDIEKHYHNKDPLFELNKSKLQSPIVVIDPVDKNRNAAAALSEEKFFRLKKIARNYLKEPSAGSFERKEVSIQSLKKEAVRKKENLIMLNAAPLKGKEDVIGVKLLKAFKFIEEKLTPFSLIEAEWEWNPSGKALFYFFTKIRELPKEEVKTGPPLKMTEHVKAFKKLYKNTFVKNNRIMTMVKTKNPKQEDFVKALLKEKYLKERTSSLKMI